MRVRAPVRSSGQLFTCSDGICHQHGDGHRADTARHRSDRGATFRDGPEIHVADYAITFGGGGIREAVDADIYNNRASANVFSCEKVWTADCGDNDIRATRD